MERDTAERQLGDARTGEGFAALWTLDPSVTFLNHGSFGACPRVVLQAQDRLRARLEAEPVRFMVRELDALLDASRAELAAFLGADAADLAFVPNATAGVNSVMRSLRFSAGDELVTTDQEYNASRNALEFAAERDGAKVVVAEVPFPLRSPAQVVEAILGKVTGRTRLVLVDHVTSQTGLVNPLPELLRELNARGIPTMVDGAHAPGMVALDLKKLGAAYYTGNCHKWICAPKGAAFLYVRSDLQQGIRPLAISHGANSPRADRSRFQIEFDWTGTYDPTAYLCVGEAIRYMGSLLPGGWPELREANRAKVLEGRKVLCEALGQPEPAPAEMIGSLAAVPLPDGAGAPMKSPLYTDALQERLMDGHGIEVPIVPWPRPPRRLIRVSAQLYNRPAEYRKLATALVAELARERGAKATG
ncbi:MAG TPA: aminotransferase class V-fold PLP-dependent enzyme [Myxococcaceae bacterium]|nr:aminotransferase class V-fold PLP-dependent enzyme [Myxococcaceae bacterium]